jgi:uncharacterized membrane protein YGL010W
VAEEPRSPVSRGAGLLLIGIGGVFALLVLNVSLILAFGGSAWWEAAVTLVLWGGLGLVIVRWGRRLAGPVFEQRRSRRRRSG